MTYGVSGLRDELLVAPFAATPEQIHAWYAMGAPFVDPQGIVDADSTPVYAANRTHVITQDGAAQYDDQGNRRVHTGHLGGLPWGDTVLPAGIYGQWGNGAGAYFRGYPRILYAASAIPWSYDFGEMQQWYGTNRVFTVPLPGAPETVIVPPGRKLLAVVTIRESRNYGTPRAFEMQHRITAGAWRHRTGGDPDMLIILPFVNTEDQPVELFDLWVTYDVGVVCFQAGHVQWQAEFDVVLMSVEADNSKLLPPGTWV